MNKKYVKVILCIIFLSVLLLVPQSVNAKSGKGINIKKTFARGTSDEIGRKRYDKNQDGYLNQTEIKEIKRLYLYTYQNDNINSNLNIRGISKLKYLERIDFNAKGDIYNLKEIKKLSKLKYVKIDRNSKKRRVFDFRKSKNLRTLDLSMKSNTGIVKVHKKSRISTLSIGGVKNGASIADRCYKARKLEIVGSNDSTSINLENRKKLVELYLDDVKKIRNLNVKNCHNLEKLSILNSDINNCNIYKIPKVKKIRVTRTEILNLAINNLEQLKKLEMAGVKVSNISMTNLNRLREIDMQEIKRLPKLTLSNLMQLQKINIDEAKKLKSLTLENLTNLKLVSCTCGILSELNILGKNKISEMNLCCNELSKFRYDNLLDLVKLNINKNKIEGKFDFTLYPSLYKLDCQNNKLTEIYGGVANREIDYIDCYNNQIKLIDFRGTTNGCILWMNCKKNPNIVVYAVVEDFEHDVTAKLYENI